MSKHLFGLVVTPCGIAANNRGETEGNITTLHRLLWGGEEYTTVSAEAIRWGIRWYWQMNEKKINRHWRDNKGSDKKVKEKPSHEWEDREFKNWKEFLDDDVLGFMDTKGKSGGEKGNAKVRRACLEVTRAISLIPFAGEVTFNVAGIGATLLAGKTGTDPVPYGTEIHATRYQYGFAMTPDDLHDRNRALDVVDAIVNLSSVGGNQSRFLFDFSPDTVIFRWTDDFAPRILYGFKEDKDTGKIGIPEIVERIKAKDIKGSELFIGGLLSKEIKKEMKESLKDSSVKNAVEEVSFFDGVKEAADKVNEKIKASLKDNVVKEVAKAKLFDIE